MASKEIYLRRAVSLLSAETKVERLRVGLYLLSKCRHDQPKAVSVGRIGEALGMRDNNVSRALAALVEQGLVEVTKSEADKRRRLFRLKRLLPRP